MIDAQSDFFAHAHRVQSFLSLNLSETDTRVHLVDPVLRILGYIDIGDIRREVQIPTSKEFIDYELRIDGRPVAIVEAKALRHAITDQDAAQCVQYASILGAPCCLITNGAVWHVYYAKVNTGALASKKVAQVRLDGDEHELAEAWRVLSLVGRESLGQANPLTKLLVERVVTDELSRQDSPAVAALRRAVQDRFHERVPPQAVLGVIARLWDVHALAAPASLSSASSLNAAASLLPQQPVTPAREPSPRLRRGPAATARVKLADLVAAGLLPEGAPIEVRVKGVSHVGQVKNGGIDVNGAWYPTPSAASMAIRQVQSWNGWTDWEYRGQTLDQLRRKLADGNGQTAEASS